MTHKVLILQCTIDDLHFPQSQHGVKRDCFTTTLVYVAGAFTIALVYANYFDVYAAWMMSYGQHLKYGNDRRDEENTTDHADLRLVGYQKCCTQMYIGFR